MKPRRSSCPTPQKVPHRTLRIAENSAKAFARAHVTYEQVDPLFAYQCRCGWWHLTRDAEGVYETVPVLTIPTALQEWARTPATRPSDDGDTERQPR